MTAIYRRVLLLGALRIGVAGLISASVTTLLDQSPGWPEQQRQLTELVRRQDPRAVLVNITADGSWTTAGVQSLSVRAEYLRPSGERIIATFESPLDVVRVTLRYKPPDGPGPVLPVFLQVSAEVQDHICIQAPGADLLDKAYSMGVAQGSTTEPSSTPVSASM